MKEIIDVIKKQADTKEPKEKRMNREQRRMEYAKKRKTKMQKDSRRKNR